MIVKSKLLSLAAILAVVGSLAFWSRSSFGDPAHTCLGENVTIEGTDRPDRLEGTEGADVIDGHGGHDLISGLGGDDKLCGGEDQDVCDGGEGTDEADASCESKNDVP
ncbi:MAG: hypothetical protein ACRDJF_12050 [Actinomycetota bacterium]